MRRLIVPALILLLTLWPALAPSAAKAEDTAAPYHPEFNGLLADLPRR